MQTHSLCTIQLTQTRTMRCLAPLRVENKLRGMGSRTVHRGLPLAFLSDSRRLSGYQTINYSRGVEGIGRGVTSVSSARIQSITHLLKELMQGHHTTGHSCRAKETEQLDALLLLARARKHHST